MVNILVEIDEDDCTFIESLSEIPDFLWAQRTCVSSVGFLLGPHVVDDLFRSLEVLKALEVLQAKLLDLRNVLVEVNKSAAVI